MLTSAMFLALIAASASPTSVPIQTQVREASLLADGMKTAVGEFVNNYDRLPVSNEEAGLPAPTLIHGQYAASGAVSGSRITFDFGRGADSSLVGKHLFFDAVVKRDEAGLVSIMWLCKSEDIPQESCPKSCSCTGNPVQDNNVSLTVVRFDDHLKFECAAKDAATASRPEWKNACNAMAATHVGDYVAAGEIAPLTAPVFDLEAAAGEKLAASVPLASKQ